MKKISINWIIAIVITLLAVFYQKKTGPTYPKKIDVSLNEKTYHLKLIRSHGRNSDANIELEIADTTIEGELFYRKYPTNENFKKIDFKREKNFLIAKLPYQEPAGKLIYYLKLKSNNEVFELSEEDAIIIRFKADVPNIFLIPHIILMFVAMLLSTLSGLLAFSKHKQYKFYAYLTFICLFLGGMILGPIVQKYAFGEFWTGIPFGWDLTDNKTLIAFLFWIIAILTNMKKSNHRYVIIASIVLLLIYSIPHSLYGSELNHETGKVIQAKL